MVIEQLSPTVEVAQTPPDPMGVIASVGNVAIREPRHESTKQAPSFAEQVHDATRINEISYMPGQKAARGAHVDALKATSLTAHEALQGLYGFLEEVAGLQDGSKPVEKATSMLEGLTFIDKREYDEATTAIATDLKQRLSENPSLQICAVAGAIRKDIVKSDTYMLDKILGNFSDEELADVKDRLVLTPADLDPDSEAVEVMLLDDWTNSGMQLGAAAEAVLKAYPKYADALSVQLIVATQDRMQRGIATKNPADGNLLVVPVKAYFAANKAMSAEAHITGSHSSVDFDFENEIGNMVYRLNKSRGDEVAVMPPLTNIIRPYRQNGYQPKSIERLRAA